MGFKTYLNEYASNKELIKKNYVHPDELFIQGTNNPGTKVVTFYFDAKNGGKLGDNVSTDPKHTHGNIIGDKMRLMDPTWGLGRLAVVDGVTMLTLWEPSRQVLKNGTSAWLTNADSERMRGLDRKKALTHVIDQLKQSEKVQKAVNLDDNTLLKLSHDKQLTVGDLSKSFSKDDTGETYQAAQHVMSPSDLNKKKKFTPKQDDESGMTKAELNFRNRQESVEIKEPLI